MFLRHLKPENKNKNVSLASDLKFSVCQRLRDQTVFHMEAMTADKESTMRTQVTVKQYMTTEQSLIARFKSRRRRRGFPDFPVALRSFRPNLPHFIEFAVFLAGFRFPHLEQVGAFVDVWSTMSLVMVVQ